VSAAWATTEKVAMKNEGFFFIVFNDFGEAAGVRAKLSAVSTLLMETGSLCNQKGLTIRLHFGQGVDWETPRRNRRQFRGKLNDFAFVAPLDATLVIATRKDHSHAGRTAKMQSLGRFVLLATRLGQIIQPRLHALAGFG